MDSLELGWKQFAVAQAQVGDSAGALKTLKALPDVFEKVEVLRAVADAQVEAGERAEARRTLLRAVFTLANNDEDRRAGFEQALLALEQARLGDFAEGLRTASDIEGESARAMALEGIAQRQTEAGDDQATLRWIAKETSPKLKSAALLGVVEGLLHRAAPSSEPRP
jgi:hypothetical protein